MKLINSENMLFNEISTMIEESRRKIYAHASGTTVLLFWQIGRRINNDILDNKRADYGKQIVSMLSTQLSDKFGSTFAVQIFDA